MEGKPTSKADDIGDQSGELSDCHVVPVPMLIGSSSDPGFHQKDHRIGMTRYGGRRYVGRDAKSEALSSYASCEARILRGSPVAADLAL
jgi:hypothetical protein